MVVKVGTTVSESCKITGGAVQGSVLGILDHNAVIESLDDNIQNIHIAKYVDDITMLDVVDKEVAIEEDNTGVCLKHTFNPPNSQLALQTIVTRATEKSMKINTSKTQILTISSSPIECRSYLTNETGDKIMDEEELKMLGFYFSPKPTV